MRHLPSRLRDRLLLELDLAQWRWQARDLTRTPVPPPQRTLLVCDLMPMIAGAKAQTVFARALAARGFRLRVLAPRRDRLLRRVYAAAGDVAFVWLDDHLDEEGHRAAAERAEAILAATPDQAALLALSVEGVRVGRNVLSWVTRRLRRGSVDLADPEHRRLVAETLARSLATIAAAARILDEVRPDLALFCERGYTPAGEVFDACLGRGIDVVQWLGAPQSDALLFKRYRLANRDVHPLALDDETWNWLQDVPWTPALDRRLMAELEAHYRTGAWFNRQQLQVGKRLQSPAEVRASLGLAPGRKAAVIFAHILYDATFFFGRSLFDDYAAWLVETVRAAIANPALDWIVKVHPVNVWRSRMDGQPLEQLEVALLRQAFGALPDHVRILPADTDINTYSLFGAIDYGLTVRGTIGMELPCFGIPVVTAGTGRYDRRGFTLDPETPAAYRALLAALHTVPRLDRPTIERARRYAFGTFLMRPKPIRAFTLDFHANRFGLPLLRQNLVLHATGRGAFRAAPDLQDIADWMADGRDIDLVDRSLLPTPAVGDGWRPADAAE